MNFFNYQPRWTMSKHALYNRKIYIVVSILLVMSNLNAQLAGGLLGYFYEKPAYEFRSAPFANKQGTDGRFVYNLTPLKFKAMINDSIWMKDYLSKKTYSFFNNGKFYMLSYEDRQFSEKELMERPQARIERNLYLYRLDDSGWTIASDKPIMVGYVDRASYVSYFPWRTAGDQPEDEKEFGNTAHNGSVILNPLDGIVTIVLINHRCDNLDKNDSKIIFFNSTVILKPNPDGTYRVQ